MKKREFKLNVCNGDNEFSVVTSTDYDEEAGLVRYKDTLYDIRTGLWAVRLPMIKKGTWSWKLAGCTRVEDLKATEMLFYVKNNIKFMNRLNRERETERVKNKPTMNGGEYNLFTID